MVNAASSASIRRFFWPPAPISLIMAKAMPPLPIPNPDTESFWKGSARGQLLLQRCTSCSAYRHPPSPLCQECLSMDHEWVAAQGRGTVYSFVVVHQSLRGEAFHVPYVVAVIELAEGPHMLSNVEGSPIEKVAIGMPVQVFFERVNDEISLPKFKPVEV